MKTISQQLKNAMQNLGSESTPIRPEMTEKAAALMTTHGSLINFKETYRPQAMITVAKDPGRAYNGIAPTLEEVHLAFGGDADLTWLCTLIDYFIEYCGKGRMSNNQIIGVAQRLSMKSHLRVTEFMLFFWRLGNAEYGRIYGDIDPLYIMDAFNKFLKQRETERSEYAVTTTEEVTATSELRPLSLDEIQAVKQGLLDQAKREGDKGWIAWFESLLK